MACRLAMTAVAQPVTSSMMDTRSTTIAPRILQRGAAGLELLLEARCFSRDLGRGIWDFAVEIERLRRGGLMHNDLRWLVCKGYVEQAIEILSGSSQERCFQAGGALTFTDTSCFVLTDEGNEFVQQLLPAEPALPDVVPHSEPSTFVASGSNGSHGATASNGRAASHFATEPHRDLLPCWDRDRQELRVGDCLVKQFKVPAPNQEMVIAVFQEEGWPPRIDDPLPPRSDLDPKRRLHDTINSLNRNQRTPLIRFLGDGSGQGVRWEPAAASDPRNCPEVVAQHGDG